MITLTYDNIQELRTDRGGFTTAVQDALKETFDLPLPLKKGWTFWLIGKVVDEARWEEIKALRLVYSEKTVKILKKSGQSLPIGGTTFSEIFSKKLPTDGSKNVTWETIDKLITLGLILPTEVFEGLTNSEANNLITILTNAHKRVGESAIS